MNLRTRSTGACSTMIGCSGASNFFNHFHTIIRRRSLRLHAKLTTPSGSSFYWTFRINLKKIFSNFSMCTSPGTLNSAQSFTQRIVVLRKYKNGLFAIWVWSPDIVQRCGQHVTGHARCGRRTDSKHSMLFGCFFLVLLDFLTVS